MSTLDNVLKSMKESQKRWCADEVDDAEEMWSEYPGFLDWAVPIIEKELERTKKLEDLISEAAPLSWAHSNSVATIEDAYAWEKKAKKLLEEK